jgi:hypothetical protein
VNNFRITYYSRYKWDDNAIVCLGSRTDLSEVVDRLLSGSTLNFEELDAAEVLLDTPPEEIGAGMHSISISKEDSAQLSAAVQWLNGPLSSKPETNYISLSDGYALILVTNEQ